MQKETSCKFEMGDVVVMPEEWDKEKKYIVLSCTDNSTKIVSTIKHASRIYKVVRISDNQIVEEPEACFKLSE